MGSSFFSRRVVPLVVFGAGLAVAYVTFDWAVGAVIHYRKVVAVPDLSGKSVQEVLNILAQVKLGLSKEGDQFDKSFPAGTVVRQSPPAGIMVREGRTVRIVVSQGGETLFVPDVVGQPIRNAQTALQNAGLGVGEIERRPSLRFDKELVMATDPPAGATVGKNSLVGVVVSEGAPAGDVVLTPDFMGKSLVEAKSWADSNQISISVKEDNDPDKPRGTITMQSPTADSPIRVGDTLTLVANASGGSDSGPHVRYQLPPSGSDRDVKIFLVDETGEKEIFRKAQPPGSVIDLPVSPKGRARARIFVNGIMVEEQQL